MRVAVMQPYFYPYMGYFRLLAAVDTFVLFDCVQFPRRGRVHRTAVLNAHDREGWLTLPLARASRETRIDALNFATGAQKELAGRMAALPWLDHLAMPEPISTALFGPLDRPIDYLERNLRAVANYLGIRTRIIRSSGFEIPKNVTGGNRVRAVAKAVNATHYLNAPGGQDLYDRKSFTAEGIELEFLAPYEGERIYMLHAICTEQSDGLIADAANFDIIRA